MEEQVLEILNESIILDGEYIDYESKEIASEEITSMVFEFIEWVRKNCEVSIGSGTWSLFDDRIGIIGYFTDKELFQYWYNNVKNK